MVNISDFMDIFFY